MRALQQETKSHLASKAADPSHLLGKPKELGRYIRAIPPVINACSALVAPLPEKVTREVILCETVHTEIVELYLKVRLFAFVDRTMEQHKKTTKEQIQNLRV